MITLACTTYRHANRIWSEHSNYVKVADSGVFQLQIRVANSDSGQLQISASGADHILGPDEERRLLEYLIERAGGLQNLALEQIENATR